MMRRLLRKLAGSTPTATRIEELRPLAWSVVDDDAGRVWLLVRSEYTRGDDGGSVVLTLRDQVAVRRAATITRGRS
jgi:hypothetical protein